MLEFEFYFLNSIKVDNYLLLLLLLLLLFLLLLISLLLLLLYFDLFNVIYY